MLFLVIFYLFNNIILHERRQTRCLLVHIVTHKVTKKPLAKPGNRVPRVKVLNYLKKVALFFRFKRDILSVSHRLTLTLAKLTQHLKVNTVITEFLFHKSVVDFWLQRYKKFVVT